MGLTRRPRPMRLAEKLKQIRLHFGLSQSEFLRELNYKESPLVGGDISKLENDKKEPPMQLVLRYARMVDIPMEVLVDDELDLPESFALKSTYFAGNYEYMNVHNCCGSATRVSN